MPFRGRGLAVLLCAEVIQQARLAGVCTLQREVLKQNERAVRTYLSAGLHVWREGAGFLPAPPACLRREAACRKLQSFEWEDRSDPIAAADLPAMQAVEPHALLDHYAALHPMTPGWAGT